MGLLRYTLLAGAIWLWLADAQSSTPTQAAGAQSSVASVTFNEADVPTGTPIPGNYTGPLRPQVHYSPPQHFLNDPNGMFVDANGTWHMYYQYNPTGDVAGNQHWGHATSRDLYHWENQPIAIFPPNNFTFVFSGSAVVDENNTSGFFPNQTNGVVAIYTLAEYPNGSPGPQQQAIAYSRDGGYTFTPYPGNPVIPSNSSQFRDPKVIRYGDRWILVLAYSQEFAVGIFSSQNLINWTHESNFSYHGLLGVQWECPNLVEMPVNGTNDTMYVLQISINPGAPLGGSIAQYFPGTFNGTHFEAVDGVARIADFGKDNYAGQFFYGVPSGEDAVSIAWASNWEYTQLVPTGPKEGWRSAMTLPHRHFLANTTRVGWDMFSTPYDPTPVIGDTLAKNSSLANSTIFVDFSDVESNAVWFEANVTGINTTTVSGTASLNFTFISPVTNEYLRGGFFFGGDMNFFLDRGGLRGFDNPFFTDKVSTVNLIDPSKGTFSLVGVLDRSVFEVFLDGGARSGTLSFFPESPLTQMTLVVAGLSKQAKVSVAVYALESAWAKYENGSGTVVGNTTATANATTSTTAAYGRRNALYHARY